MNALAAAATRGLSKSRPITPAATGFVARLSSSLPAQGSKASGNGCELVSSPLIRVRAPTLFLWTFPSDLELVRGAPWMNLAKISPFLLFAVRGYPFSNLLCSPFFGGGRYDTSRTYQYFLEQPAVPQTQNWTSGRRGCDGFKPLRRSSSPMQVFRFFVIKEAQQYCRKS